MSADSYGASVGLSRLETASGWLRTLPVGVFWLIAGSVAVLKGGVAGVGPNFLVALRGAAEGFPDPVSSFSTSVGSLLLMRLAGFPSGPVWWALGAVGLAALVVGLLLASRRLGDWSRHAALLLLASPAFATLLSMLGHYDLLTVAGSVVVAVGRSRASLVVGVLVASVGNPEQALVAALAMFAAAWVLQSALRVRAAVFLGVATVSVLVVQWWVRSAGLAESRLELVVGGTTLAMRIFAGTWPVYLYSLLGALWLVVAALVVFRSGVRVPAALAVGLGIPLLATVFTLDVTRVFVVTSTAALLTVLRHVWQTTLRHTPPPAWLLGAMAIAFAVMPTIVILPEPTGIVRLPYDELLTFLGWPVDWSLRR